jgi:competence protein ComFC
MLKRINKIILDTLFPIYCLFCGNGNAYVCDKCLRKIRIVSSQVCPYCEKANVPEGKICLHCKDKFLTKRVDVPVDNLIIATKYKESNVSHLVHIYKYRFASDLFTPLGKLMVASLIENNLPLPDLIIPVPLHKRRLRWRGFNQAELLANYISLNLAPGMEIPVLNDLIFRKRHTTSQMKIKNYSKRKKNMQNAFVVDKKKIHSILNKKILLVDDVATTGSTLFECGRALKIHGADKIYASVVARQEWKSVL